MSKFSVPDMSCGHCTAAIEKQIKAADAAASVACDLETHTVTVASSLGTEALIAEFKEAGYDATPA